MDQVHGLENGTHGLPERIASGVSHRPQAKRESMLGLRLEQVGHFVILLAVVSLRLSATSIVFIKFGDRGRPVKAKSPVSL
jgi:ribosomal protein L30/L7E